MRRSRLFLFALVIFFNYHHVPQPTEETFAPIHHHVHIESFREELAGPATGATGELEKRAVKELEVDESSCRIQPGSDLSVC